MERARHEGWTRHHALFPRVAHNKASKVHKVMRGLPGLIVPLPPELHNQGEDSLHANVFGVATVAPYLAKRAMEIVEPYVKPEDYLHNIDVLALGFEHAAQKALCTPDKDICRFAAESVIAQRSYIAGAYGNRGIYVLDLAGETV